MISNKINLYKGKEGNEASVSSKTQQMLLAQGKLRAKMFHPVVLWELNMQWQNKKKTKKNQKDLIPEIHWKY